MFPPEKFVLPLGRRLAYSVGHVQNDLFAAMWFSYLLLYLQMVMRIPVTTAGIIFLVGQFCDGLLNPLIAYESDRISWKWYGKRKTTHLIGIIIISLTFPFVFTRCPGCEDAPYWALILYFIPLVCLFQAGWAAVQVSHLSLIPELTNVPKERDELNIVRYAFDILTDTSVYIITYFVLKYYSDDGIPEDAIGPEDAVIFRNISWILLAVGLIFTLIFHVFTPEKVEEVPPRSFSSEDSSFDSSFMIWKDWFKLSSFYKIAILFSVSRVITNILQAFVPLYLQEGTRAPQALIALIPLLINMSGFLSSLLVKPVTRYVDKKTLFITAAGLSLIGCIWFIWDDPISIREGNIYFIAIFSGMGGSTMLVLALSLATDLIGDNTETGGFVYGCMAFSEKIINGIVILAFQMGKGICPECNNYYRNVLSYGVLFFTLVNIAAMLGLSLTQMGLQKTLILSLNGDNESRDYESPLLGESVGGGLKNKKYGSTRKGFSLLFGNFLRQQ